jgi:hypothetical protein
MRHSITAAATAAGMFIVCFAIGHRNLAHSNLHSSRLLATLLSYTPGLILSACRRLC